MKMEERINPPKKYAILSHTWGREEVTFTDYLQNDSCKPEANGFKKIQYTCKQAKNNQIPFAWIDTCCIDKSSSAELSEAINSMYKWYQSATVCYVYLEDVEAITGDAQEFRNSRWFKRGWTLQELLAPESIEFYGRSWTYLGSKGDLLQHVASASGVFETVLRNPYMLRTTSVAARMSWASDRKTTRKEDRAYSLLGIFNVHMPLLYGEGGEKAFIRLQEEIIKTSDDESLIAWRQRGRSSLLADSPRCFKGMRDVVSLKIDPEVSTGNTPREPFSLTNRGLKIELPLVEQTDEREIIYGVLACCKLSAPDYYLALPLRSSGTGSENVFEISTVGLLPSPQSCMIKRASFSSTNYRKIIILGDGGFQAAVFLCGISTEAQFEFCPLFNLSFTYWDDKSYPMYKQAAATKLLPNQTKVIIQFTVSWISEPGIAFLGIVERDLMCNKTSIHAILKRSDLWPEDGLETAGDIYSTSMTSLPPTTHNTKGLGMCWRSHNNSLFFVSFMNVHGLEIRGRKFYRSSKHFARLEKLVDQSPFDLAEIFPEGMHYLMFQYEFLSSN
jgi:hypothetical protein